MGVATHTIVFLLEFAVIPAISHRGLFVRAITLRNAQTYAHQATHSARRRARMVQRTDARALGNTQTHTCGAMHRRARQRTGAGALDNAQAQAHWATGTDHGNVECFLLAA